MKRLNVKLALWLVGITVFSVVGVYFLHGYQEDRNAEYLKLQAEQAKTAGNDEEAIKLYSQYIRHRNDREGYQSLADLTVKVAKLPTATNRDRAIAYDVLEEAIRRHPDLDEVREQLIDFSIMHRQFNSALDHIKALEENNKGTADLEVKKALIRYSNGEEDAAETMLYKLVGYDTETQQFLEDAPETANTVDPYLLLERIIRRKGDNTAFIEDLMLKLVERNPDLAKAHLARGSYLLGTWQTVRPDTPEGKDLRDRLLTDAKAELKRTVELEPDNADAMLMTASIAMLEEDPTTAKSLLDKALENHPDRADVYLRRYQLALTENDRAKAEEELKTGAAKASNPRPLLEQLIELQLQSSNLASARKTCEEMRKIENIPPEFIDYQEARLMLGEGKVLNATSELERVRPAIERLNPMHSNTLNMLLARCYGVLSMPDRQLEAYRRILTAQPGMILAQIGEAEALQALGRFSESERTIEALTANAPATPALVPQILQLAVNLELDKDPATRNWSKTEKLSAILEESGQQNPVQSQLFKADMLLTQGKTEEALALLSALRKEDPKNQMVWMSLAKLMSNDPKYRDRMPQLIALAEKELGTTAPLVAEKIKLAVRKTGDEAIAELKQLEAGLSAFEPAQQQSLRGTLATAYLQLGDYENGSRCLKSVIANDPNNIRVRLALFDLATERGDDATAEEIVKEVRTSPSFGTNSALYKYCDAAAKLNKFVNARTDHTAALTAADQTLLTEVRKSVDEGLVIRPEWAPLWRLRGDIDRIEGNLTSAIVNYQRSLDYSQANQEGTARKLVALLYATQRYTEANAAMQYLGGGDLPEAMRRLVMDTKYRTGDTKSAIELARKDIEKDPDNPMNYVVYGQLLESNADTANAEKAYRAAVAKEPKLTMAWERLVKILVDGNKTEDAKKAVETASQALPDNELAVGRLYLRLKDTAEAKKHYEAAIAKKSDDIIAHQHLAELLLVDNQAEKATELLDKIIALGANSKDQTELRIAAWARTQKARSMAPSRDYANTMKAVEMIEQNAKDGELDGLDLVTIVQLLAPRIDEPSSRAKAIGILEKVRARGDMPPQNEVALAQLYNRDGNWEEAKRLMTNAVTAQESAETTILLAQMHFDHEEFEDALQYVNQTESLLRSQGTPLDNPLSRGVRVLKAQLLAREGNLDEAAQVLEAWLPRPLAQDKLNLLFDVAMQLDALKLYPQSQKLFEEYAQLSPTSGKVALAAFHGRRGDIDRSFAMLKEVRDSANLFEILPVVLANLRNFPEKRTPEMLSDVEQWLTSDTVDTQDPLRLKLLLAEYYDLRGRYSDVEKIYRDMLADPNIPETTKAIVENNLAFVLAAVTPTQQRGAEAEKLIAHAISLLGPTSDLLDTRALAYLAQGKTDQAAADIRVAAKDRPSTSKLYHLALVEKQLGNVDAAKEAVGKAEELQGEHNSFTPAEREGFDKLKSELN